MERWALVTGGAKRLGREMSLALARNGWCVAIHCRHSREEASETLKEIKQLGVDAVVETADLSRPDAVSAMASGLFQKHPFRCLVNNASVFEFDQARQLTPELFTVHMNTNLLAPLLLSRALYEHIPEPERGVVVNLLDQKLYNLNPDFLSYTLSKSALQTATTLLATELAPRLRVVGVAPGLTMISHLQTPEQFEATHRISPLHRSSQPEDIASAVVFAVNSPAITGTTLLVDGGQHLVPMARDFSMMEKS